MRYQFFSTLAFSLIAASCARQPEPEKSSPTQITRPVATLEQSAAEPRTVSPKSDKPGASPGVKPIVPPNADKPPAVATKANEIPADERDKISGLISFISERDGQREVYIIRANGTGEKRFTNNKNADYNGPFSPDGSSLLVIRAEGEDGPQKLYLWPLDGSEPKRLGPDTGRIRFPNFTPDGKFIVFESNGSKEMLSHFCDIYRIDSAGKKLERLTNNPEGNFEPAVSPKGEAIVHVSSRDRVAELYATKLDGKSPQRVTNTDRDEWGARFSPDGKQIAFISDREGAQRIWLMEFPSGEARRLTQRSPVSSRITEDKIAWAPTGKKIAYVLTIPDTPSSVVIFDLENGKETVLRSPTGSGQVSDPWWSPDGRYVAVTVGSEQDQQIWIARENGSAWVKLTNSPGGNWNPIWGGKTKK